MHDDHPEAEWSDALVACQRCGAVVRASEAEFGCRFGEPHCAVPLRRHLAERHRDGHTRSLR